MLLRFTVLCFVSLVTFQRLLAQDGVKPAPVKLAPVKPLPAEARPVEVVDAVPPVPLAPFLPAVPPQRVILKGQNLNFAFAANQIRLSQLSLSQLIRAKIRVVDGGPARLILMLESFRQRKGDKVVNEMVPEERTREVTVNGKVVKQTFTVIKQVSRVEPNADISVAAGIKPQTFDAKDFEFHDLAGEPLNVDAAAKRLTKLMPVFLLEQHHGKVRGLSEIAQQALSDDCLIVTTTKQIRPQPQMPANQWQRRVLPPIRVAPIAAPLIDVLPMPAPALPPQPAE